MLSLWLLTGIFRRPAWAVALVCFTLFSCVTLYQVISGKSSCGCFGKVPISPHAMFVVDVTAVTMLLLLRPRRRAFSFIGVHPAWLAVLGSLYLVVAIPSAVAMAAFSPSTLNTKGELMGDSPIVVLEPDKWMGEPCPILNYIDIGKRLAEGKWLVVLYHHDCPNCQEELPKYERLARRTAQQVDARQVALIQMPPYADDVAVTLRRQSSCVHGHLNDKRDWFASTPLVLFTVDGICVPPMNEITKLAFSLDVQ